MDTHNSNKKSIEYKKSASKKSYWNILISAVFFGIIFVMLLLRVILPVPEFSYAENRKLAELPSASFERVFFGGYTQEFDNYFSDTFPLRDTFMSTEDYVSYLYRIPLKGVDTFVAIEDNEMQMDLDDEEEYYDNETQQIIPETSVLSESITLDEQVESFSTPTPEPIPELPDEEMETKGKYLMTDTAIYQQLFLNPEAYTTWAEGINRLQEQLPDTNVFVMSPPGSYQFYAQEEYYTPEADQVIGLRDFYSKLNDGIIGIDMTPLLMQHRDEYIYFRTDHHWTGLGAYYAYIAFCESISIVPQDIALMEKREYEKDFLGSFYKTLKKTAKAKIIRNSPDRVEYYVPPYQCEVLMYKYATLKKSNEVPMFDMDIPSASTNYYRVFLGGDYPCLRLTSDVKNGKSIVVVKDSYGNAFIPYLTANYETVYVIDFRDFNTKDRPKLKIADFIEEHAIDDVLCVMYFGYANNYKRVKWFLRILP